MKSSCKEKYVLSRRFRLDFSLSSSPIEPSPFVLEEMAKIRKEGSSITSYPQAGYGELKEAIASFHGVLADQVILGTGLDGLLFDSISRLLGPKDELLLPLVTFQNPAHFAQAQGSRVTHTRMRESLNVDVESLLEALGPSTRILFLCHPNNPTGLLESLDSIRWLLESTSALLLLDEANIQFSSAESGLSLIQEYENLVVLRSFSKAYGLAGMRVGYGISRSPLLKKVEQERPPFFLSTISVVAARAALMDQKHMEKVVAYTVQERRFLEEELQRLGFTTTPSCSNTLLLGLPPQVSASSLLERLHSFDCHAVHGSHFNLDDRYLRIAPRLHEANEELISLIGRCV